MIHREPSTPTEWQTAVDLAEVMLHLEAARVYGLVTAGPTVDVIRCVEILARGRLRGVTPIAEHTDRLLGEAAAASWSFRPERAARP